MHSVPLQFDQPKADNVTPLVVNHQPELTSKVMDDEPIGFMVSLPEKLREHAYAFRQPKTSCMRSI